MLSSESERVAPLIKEVILPLTYYSEAARSAEIAKYSAESLQALVHDDAYSVLLAESEDRIEPVGFCISRYDDGVIWLAWFGVCGICRGQGVGSILLKALEEATRARGCAKIWCDTRTDNLISQRALERAGFIKICALFNHWYGQDFYLWEKFLETTS
jgi:ribosomal protein S18 acetylase RimI-like enzyme